VGYKVLGPAGQVHNTFLRVDYKISIDVSSAARSVKSESLRSPTGTHLTVNRTCRVFFFLGFGPGWSSGLARSRSLYPVNVRLYNKSPWRGLKSTKGEAGEERKKFKKGKKPWKLKLEV